MFKFTFTARQTEIVANALQNRLQYMLKLPPEKIRRDEYEMVEDMLTQISLARREWLKMAPKEPKD